MDLTGRKPILCLDFDGVCHSYTSGWKGADVIPDPPVPGLFEFLANMSGDFEINIFSSRTGQIGGKTAMKKWFQDSYVEWHLQKFPGDDNAIALSQARAMVQDVWKFPSEKPPAVVTLDDRGILFTGEWPSLETLKSFKPWYQQGKAAYL